MISFSLFRLIQLSDQDILTREQEQCFVRLANELGSETLPEKNSKSFRVEQEETESFT